MHRSTTVPLATKIAWLVTNHLPTIMPARAVAVIWTPATSATPHSTTHFRSIMAEPMGNAPRATPTTILPLIPAPIVTMPTKWQRNMLMKGLTTLRGDVWRAMPMAKNQMMIDDGYFGLGFLQNVMRGA
jgi:hypothetical protein